MKILKSIIFTSLVLLLLVMGIIFMPFNNTQRPLTESELHELHSIFYEDVDYSKILITTANLPPTMAAYVFGNSIIYRKQYYLEDFSENYLKMGRLVHEIGHIWANQSKGFQTSLAAFTEHLKHKDRVYAHGPLTDNRSLDDFRYEQQCQILSDYYINRYLEFDTSAYEVTIYKSINKP